MRNACYPQEILKRKDEFQFLDSAPYFLNKAEKLVGEDYLPSDDDVLRARSMTTGIVTFPFEVSTSVMKYFLSDMKNI